MSKILCIAKSAFDGLAQNENHNSFGLYSSVAWIWASPLFEGGQFLERDEVEDDEGLLQIIPYVVLINVNPELQVLTYARGKAGQEARLHDKFSFGFGGHIDEPDRQATMAETVLVAATRELKEELNLGHHVRSDEFCGLIFTPEDAVGRVHLGALFIVPHHDWHASAPEIQKLHWADLVQLRGRELENWSKACMPYLEQGSYAHQLSDTQMFHHCRHLQNKLQQLEEAGSQLRPRLSRVSELTIQRLTAQHKEARVIRIENRHYSVSRQFGIREIQVDTLQ